MEETKTSNVEKKRVAHVLVEDWEPQDCVPGYTRPHAILYAVDLDADDEDYAGMSDEERLSSHDYINWHGDAVMSMHIVCIDGDADEDLDDDELDELRERYPNDWYIYRDMKTGQYCSIDDLLRRYPDLYLLCMDVFAKIRAP